MNGWKLITRYAGIDWLSLSRWDAFFADGQAVDAGTVIVTGNWR